MTTGARRGRSRELAVAAVVAALLAGGAFLVVRYVKHRNDDDAVATTLQKVRADAAPIRGERWDRVRASSLRGGPGGVVDLFKDVGRPNHVTYADDVLRVELSTGADAARSCVTVTLRRDSTIYTTGRCTPGRD